jgi:hypothetical protein
MSLTWWNTPKLLLWHLICSFGNITKFQTMNKLILFLVLIIPGFTGINASDIRFQAQRPAIINIPAHIQSIAIIDRSGQAKSSRNIIEQGLTGEIAGEDKIASQYAIDGLIDMLQTSGRFTVVRTGKILLKDGSAKEFPAPLSWSEIDQYCAEFKVDALISLELFDSDYIIPTSMAFVSIGFRLYDPSQKIIFDQDQFRHEMAWGSQVTSVAGAINRMVEKTKAIRNVSYDAGYIYGQRIAPSWFTVVREYYRKGKHDQNLKAGARMMEVNDWEAAIELLNTTITSGKRKAQGRAAHNLAVIYEIKGDLVEAKKWAQAAWGKYNNRNSRNYSYILGERITEQEILRNQVGN